MEDSAWMHPDLCRIDSFEYPTLLPLYHATYSVSYPCVFFYLDP